MQRHEPNATPPFLKSLRPLFIVAAGALLLCAAPVQAELNQEIVLYTGGETGLYISDGSDYDANKSANAYYSEGIESSDDGVLVLPELSDTAVDNYDYPITNNISLGDFIVDERQLLYQTHVVNAEFIDAPVMEVIRGLAEAADINYVLPKFSSEKISIRLRMPAFRALELIANQGGMEVVKEKDLWFIRKANEKKLVASVYQLRNIHLGIRSGGGSAGEDGSSFGAGSDSDSDDSSDDSSDSSNNDDSSDDDSDDSDDGDSDSGTSTVLEDVADRIEKGSAVLDTIREILGIPVQKKNLGGEIGDGEDNRSSDSDDEEEEVDAFVSYNSEANTLYVIATESQHAWVSRYLETVDKAVSNIAIDALFIESDMNPNQAMGVNWGEVASGYTFRAGTDDGEGDLSFKTFDDPILPKGVIFEADALQATVRAWIQENKARVARYPRVVTANNKLVKIQTTTNIPILTNAKTSAVASDSTNESTNTSNTTTDYDTGTQEIGTIIHIIPQQINDQMVFLRIGIEISSEDADSSGESITGRIATSSTVYEGDVKVPSGKTLAIGGLEVISETSNIRRIPWLSEIPLFGFLFKDKEKDFRRTNITLLLTPTILADMDAKTLLPSQFRDTRDERIMDDIDAVEMRATHADYLYRNR